MKLALGDEPSLPPPPPHICGTQGAPQLDGYWFANLANICSDSYAATKIIENPPAFTRIFVKRNPTYSLFYSDSLGTFVLNKHPYVCYAVLLGKKSRIPLIVKGEGLGPAMQINCNLMEMKNIFIGHTVSYEVRLDKKNINQFVNANIASNCSYPFWIPAGSAVQQRAD